MDTKAFNSISYGVFLLSTKHEGKVNACITNTLMQVTSQPMRVAITCINQNYTCELIKKSGVFCVTVLDESCAFETIKHFGFQSGRDVDKFEFIQLPEDSQGLPYLGWQSCARFGCKVVEQLDLGTHTLFIADVVEAETLGGKKPMTYAYYHEHVKPKPAKPASEKKIRGWRCRICGYVYEGETLPADFSCPLCGHDASDFEPIYE